MPSPSAKTIWKIFMELYVHVYMYHNTNGFHRSYAYRTGHWSDNEGDGWFPQPKYLQTVRVGSRT